MRKFDIKNQFPFEQYQIYFSLFQYYNFITF